MKRNTRKRRGFTLIEVTLAIVIGIIMIAGATLIYNQAKTSAGNSRAQAKTASLQSLIEQYMARADGVAPDTAALRAMWFRQRPDDYNKSPWGGLVVPAQQTQVNNGPATDTNGILDGLALTPDNTQVAGTVIGGVPGTNTGAVAGPTDPSYQAAGAAAGSLIFYKWPDARTFGVWDENRRGVMYAKTYTVATTNQRGERWFFVRGNSAGIAGDDTLKIQGQIQN